MPSKPPVTNKPLTGKELDEFIIRHKCSSKSVATLANEVGISCADYLDRFEELSEEGKLILKMSETTKEAIKERILVANEKRTIQFSESEIEDMRRMKAQGYNVKIIGDKYDVSAGVILNTLHDPEGRISEIGRLEYLRNRKALLKRFREHIWTKTLVNKIVTFSEDDILFMHELLDEQVPLADIAEATGTCRNTLARILNKWG